MPKIIKTKIALGIGVLFALLLFISVLSFVFINLLSNRTENLLSANYKTIQYCNQMMHSLNAMQTDCSKTASFEKNLQLQENNITEDGEQNSTQKLRLFFEMYKKEKDTSLIDSMNKQIYEVTLLNQHALDRKNKDALTTAESAKLWISIFATLIVILGLTIMINLPGYIANPIKTLTEGIKEIASKNYHKRIYLKNKDEFGEMANAFNQMAQKLFEYENSNLNKIIFEKQRVDTIINQMEDAVIGLDARNKVLFINNTAQLLLNLNAADIKGKYAPDIALSNDLLRTVLQKDQNRKPLKIIVTGKENYFSIDNKTVYNEGEVIGEVFILKNITVFKELDISKTNLLATISHELKTPISSIKMSVKLLEDERVGRTNTEQKDLVRNIKDDADRLLHITAELLNMTQLETGNIQLKMQSVDPKDIVRNAINAVQVQAHQKNINIREHFDDGLQNVMADADKTSWVLVNILTNAIKYSPGDEQVLVSVKQNNGTIEFSVKDSGPGIQEKYADKVFDRYFKIPGNVQSGTGLGLAISMEFIEAQRGSIYFVNNQDKGVTFYFTLPVS